MVLKYFIFEFVKWLDPEQLCVPSHPTEEQVPKWFMEKQAAKMSAAIVFCQNAIYLQLVSI